MGDRMMTVEYGGQLVREAKELAEKEQVDLDIALKAVVGAKHAIGLYQIKDEVIVLKDVLNKMDLFY
jgi:hypothetical protein|tara:strand:- start:2926 stop:3126 length:201 start_codon:yes stop_codon:yes gene_type:complete